MYLQLEDEATDVKKARRKRIARALQNGKKEKAKRKNKNVLQNF
jgi:hypothetical protein